jgi:hypothetical protein
MKTAPRDGTPVNIHTADGLVPAYFLYCKWLRDGGDDVPDCWRPDYERRTKQDSDVEISEALGWSPL